MHITSKNVKNKLCMYEGKFAKCTSAEQRREIVLNMSRRNQGQSIVLRQELIEFE